MSGTGRTAWAARSARRHPGFFNPCKNTRKDGTAMSIREAPTGDFETDLTQLLPRLRIYALSLTRDPIRADDLVQQTVLRSLAGRKSFRPGTNFPGWLFRIQRNEFISGLRRERPTVELNDAIVNTLAQPHRQESAIVLREFMTAFRT